MKTKFLLNPKVTFLNHGSFGACPKEVFNTYQKWQLKLENQPVDFLVRKSTKLLESARSQLADFLNTESNNIAFITNTTSGINAIAKSLNLADKDIVLTSDNEYGACDRTWETLSKEKGYIYKKVNIPLPIENKQQIIDVFEKNINKKTKVIFLSHITSSTALIFPIKEICHIAKENNIITVIDGAHGPGQIKINLKELNADFYVGNCHKWMLGPKGSAFIYAKPEYQNILIPPVISWGNTWEFPNKSKFIAEFEMQGTRDISAFLSIPSAINFMHKNKWEQVHQKAKERIKNAKEQLTQILKTEPITNDLSFFGQMYAHPLPSKINIDKLRLTLFKDNKIEIPITRIGEKYFIRPSFQAYNTDKEYELLFNVLKKFH